MAIHKLFRRVLLSDRPYPWCRQTRDHAPPLRWETVRPLRARMETALPFDWVEWVLVRIHVLDHLTPW